MSGLSTTSAFAFSTIGVTPYYRQYMEQKLLKELYPKLVHMKDGDDMNLPRGNGLTIEWRRPQRISVTAASSYALTEGVTPSALTRGTTEVKATVGQYGGWFPTTDLAEIISIDDFVKRDTETLGAFIGEVNDLSVRAVINQGTNVIYAAGRANRGAVTSSDVLTDAELKKAVTFLENNNVPKFPDGTYHAILPSRSKYDIQSTDGFKYTGYYQKAEWIETGKIGQLYGITFMPTTLNTYYDNEGSGSIDVEATIVYGPNAFGVPKLAELSLAFINMKVGSAGAADPLMQRGSRGTKSALGSAILDDRRMVRIEHAATVTR